MNKVATSFIISLVLNLIFLITELLLQDFLQSSSLSFIESIQSIRITFLDLTFQAISRFSISAATVTGFCIFTYRKTVGSSLGIAVVFLAIFTGDVLKNLIAHPRPFWTDPLITPLSCPKDFGSPSGHSLTIGSLVFFYWIRYFYKSKFLISVTAGLVLIIIAVDRLYLGVHFYSQVILGYSTALSLAVLFNFASVKIFLKEATQSVKSQVLLQCGFAVLSLASFSVYFTRKVDFHEEWKSNFKISCLSDINSSSALYAAFCESSSIIILSGLYFGMFAYRNKPEESKGNTVVGFLLLSFGGLTERLLVGKVNENIVLLWGFKFFIGVYVSVFIPFFVSLYSRFRKRLINS